MGQYDKGGALLRQRIKKGAIKAPWRYRGKKEVVLFYRVDLTDARPAAADHR